MEPEQMAEIAKALPAQVYMRQGQLVIEYASFADLKARLHDTALVFAMLKCNRLLAEQAKTQGVRCISEGISRSRTWTESSSQTCDRKED